LGNPLRAANVAIAGPGLFPLLEIPPKKPGQKLLCGESISDHSMVKKEWGGRSRVVGLAIDAAREAVAEAGWSDEDTHSAALVVGTSREDCRMDSVRSSGPYGRRRACRELSRELAMTLGPKLTVSTACASGLLALIRGVLMIKAGDAKRVLVVAAEASVHDLFLGSFRKLGVLAKPGQSCRPFDKTQSGFLMSEAGAAVCLQAAGEGDAGSVVIERMAMGADSTHLISGDDTGRTLRALIQDIIDGRPVDLIHAHGTGTAANDAMELSAMKIPSPRQGECGRRFIRTKAPSATPSARPDWFRW